MIKTFPSIRHIDEILPYIEQREEFFRGNGSPHFDIITYRIIDSDTFSGGSEHENAIRRECRGLLFHKDGSVARRGFQKFFNVGETEETTEKSLDLGTPHSILEKLDGSMVAPFVSQYNQRVF